MVLIGFPDLESDDDGGGPNNGITVNECVVAPAVCAISTTPGSAGSELCQGSYRYPRDGQCPGTHPTAVKSFRHCLDQGVTVTVPEAGTSVSAGTSKRWVADPFTPDMKDYCVSRCGGLQTCVDWCEDERLRKNATNDAEIKSGGISMNNQTMATYTCSEQYGYYQPPTFGTGQGEYRISTLSGPNNNNDVVCCN